MILTDYLIDRTYTETVDEVNNSPAILFSNSTSSDFGNVYIFEKFGSENTNSIKFTSQITTHYMEDNTARQDHWAINPVTYTLSGLIGELIYSPPKGFAKFIQTNVVDYLAPLGMLLPSFGSYTQSAINAAQAIQASLNRYRQIYTQALNDFANINYATINQQRVTKWLQSLRDNRQLVNVWTPYGEYNNLAINDFGLTQNDTKYQSNLEIQFIQWRNVSSLKRKATKEEQAYFFQCQNAETEQIGTASTNRSELKEIYKYKTQDFWGNPT